MTNFAVLSEDNIVLNIVIGDSLEIVEEIVGKKCLEYGENDRPHIGFAYDSKTKTFKQPEVITIIPGEVVE